MSEEINEDNCVLSDLELSVLNVIINRDIKNVEKYPNSDYYYGHKLRHLFQKINKLNDLAKLAAKQRFVGIGLLQEQKQ